MRQVHTRTAWRNIFSCRVHVWPRVDRELSSFTGAGAGYMVTRDVATLLAYPPVPLAFQKAEDRRLGLVRAHPKRLQTSPPPPFQGGG